MQGIGWETVIIDEAHRMKSTGSSTRTVIAGMDITWLLLLTGGCGVLGAVGWGLLLLSAVGRGLPAPELALSR